MHAHMHACTHARTHARTHTHTHTHMCVHACLPTQHTGLTLMESVHIFFSITVTVFQDLLVHNVYYKLNKLTILVFTASVFNTACIVDWAFKKQ